jgi:hypothetical protein
MLPSNIELLKHILDEINFVLEETEHKEFESFIEDGVLKEL